ncbi:Cardiolipin synthase [Zostera marina]|uniref:Cardiolipin synthase n=1 Tax=Zostera marina TaxID=29655 RepID=A0A0K9NMI1_ZOSMR|nr:Cardiolipin synthase [Zostera marina]
MLIFKTLIRSNLISTKISNIRTHILCSQSITTMATSAILKSAHYPFAPFLLPPSLPAVIRLTSCGEISQQSSFGPLFLSSAPWMLMQSATPMYLLGTDVKSSVGFTDTVRREKVASSGLWIARNYENVSVMEDGIFNLPNLISISRMLSGPIIGWMILNEWYISSFVALGLSGMTDWLDGFVARKMNINSVLGSYLDPLADKVLICSVALAMVKKDLLHAWLVQLVVLRDVILVSGAVYKRSSSSDWKWKSWFDFFSLNTICPERVQPLFLSKVNTVFQLTLVTIALLQPEFGTEETQVYITYLSWLVASTTVASTVAYGVQHLYKTAATVSVR